MQPVLSARVVPRAGGHALPDHAEKRPPVQTHNPPLGGDVC